LDLTWIIGIMTMTGDNLGLGLHVILLS